LSHILLYSSYFDDFNVHRATLLSFSELEFVNVATYIQWLCDVLNCV